MKRWLSWMILPILTCVGILANRASIPELLKDTDTKVLLATIRERNDPLSWFRGDWPLQNHFYRPVSTLSFELDNALYGDNSAGYGLTNALIAVCCVLLLFWLVREVTESPAIAGLSAALFGMWHLPQGWLAWLPMLCWAVAAVSLVGFVRGGRWAVVVSGLTFVFLGTLTQPSMPFDDRIVYWLPGRTASVMTVFCLAAMAAYARFERLAATPSLTKPSALDLPATKSTQRLRSSKLWPMVVVSLVCAAVAMGSYEQAVMLPAAITALFVYFKLGGRKPNPLFLAGFWVLLLAYLAVRFSLVPTTTSGYQEQQLRHGGGVLLALMDYLLPAWNWFTVLTLSLSTSWILLLVPQTWVLIAQISGNALSWYATWRHPVRLQVVAFFAFGVLSFLPMAWLQPFGHYHYWPSAMRAVYFVCLAVVAVRALANAVSLPALQAPPRPSPAPGSLPRH